MMARDRLVVSNEFGRRQVEIVCPFCGRTYIVFAWSFAGVGKWCDCGAKLGHLVAFKERD